MHPSCIKHSISLHSFIFILTWIVSRFDDADSPWNVRMDSGLSVDNQQHGTYLKAVVEPSTSHERSRGTYLNPVQVSQEGQRPTASPFFPPSSPSDFDPDNNRAGVEFSWRGGEWNDDIPPEAFRRPTPSGFPRRPWNNPVGSSRPGFVVRSPGQVEPQNAHDPFGRSSEDVGGSRIWRRRIIQ